MSKIFKLSVFYKYMGFSIYKRSNLDGEGKEYPILHMQL